ncbi:NAD synthetase [Acidovorax phage ACP17]|uniref:Putative endonuclease SegE-like GIY-YIG domain-containing protein n=1 Tax=Acidovorax phage ACP17 TaxID=2010329 RepID=A0A218M3D2_9CAUD|nr:NAD synthetase [Acidovorax phage ACP17]ASD50554.1 hypothetical protein [Acidovorax phage ACP17]
MIYESNPWMFHGQPFLEVPKGVVSFVYKLTHAETGKAYIGKKGFFFAKTKQVKGKKKRVKVDSDWREYFSSSDEIKAMVADGQHFTREILHLCYGTGEANYLEAREQMDNRVLENPDKWFNLQIQCRVHHTHLKKMSARV